MFARKWRVEVVIEGQRQRCPLEWLDAFCMRNFTGAAEFDDTLPTGPGAIEASFRVTKERMEPALAEFLTRRGKAGGKQVVVVMTEEARK